MINRNFSAVEFLTLKDTILPISLKMKFQILDTTLEGKILRVVLEGENEKVNFPIWRICEKNRVKQFFSISVPTAASQKASLPCWSFF